MPPRQLATCAGSRRCMDQFDRAQELDARYRRQALDEWSKSISDGESETHCRECGDEIPEARRLAAPGCTRCRDCQQERENSQR